MRSPGARCADSIAPNQEGPPVTAGFFYTDFRGSGIAGGRDAGSLRRNMIFRRRLIPSFLFAISLVGFAGTARAGLSPDAAALAEDVAAAKKLFEKSSVWRAASKQALTDMADRLGEKSLTSGDLNRIYFGAENYVRQQRRWQALMDCQGDEAWEAMGPGAAKNPAARIQAKLVLAAALMRHDDYLLGVEPWFKQDKTRRLLKNDHPAVEGELDASVRHFLNPLIRQQLARAVVWFRAEGVKAAGRTPDEIYLDRIIASSSGYAFFTKNLGERLLAEWRTGGHAAVTFVADHVENLGELAESAVSGAVGNTVGMVELRKGFLTTLTTDDRARLAGGFKPLDVMFEKTPFRLTDKSIPGHYGHVAVWVGSESDLKALGVWDDPLVAPHREKIRAGARIIEALRPGVEINTFDHFLNIDDLLVVRSVAPMTPEETRAGVLRAFAQLGKSYDFNFNVESDREIVCSELAFVVFPAIPWPTSRVLGRYSITPDQVAVKALDGGPFRPVCIFYDGVEVKDRLPESLAVLLKDDVAGFQLLHPGFAGKTVK